MAHKLTLTPNHTYATRDNAVKAVEKRFGANQEHFADSELRYLIVQHDDGRYFPVFIGAQAVSAGVHFHFNVVA